MGEITVEEKLNLLAGQMYMAAGIGTWGFGEKGELFYSTSANQDEFLAFFKMGGCFAFVREKEDGWKRPIVLSDSIGLLWIAENADMHDGKYRLLVVMGPFFMSSTSLKQIEEELRKKESSVYVRRQMMRVLSDVPVIGNNMLTQYAAMLHYMITEERLNKDEILYQENPVRRENKTTKSPTMAFDRKEYNEKLLLKAVREGNGKILENVEADRGMDNNLISGCGDSLRDGKNTVIVFEALCCRAAIEGGVPGQIARRMEYDFISEIEKCSTLTELINVHLGIYRKWIDTVHEYKKKEELSDTILAACDYIKSHILSELSVEKMAEEFGYTPYYFTKKFYKEMGMRVTDYIKQSKIEYARLLLLTTRKPIQEISDLLHFGTRSYFSKVFQEQVGITPAVYRDNATREMRK